MRGKKLWVPEKYEEYYYIADPFLHEICCGVWVGHEMLLDSYRLADGNLFKSKKDAEKMCAKICEFVRKERGVG